MSFSLVYFVIVSFAFCAAMVWVALRANANKLSLKRAMDLSLIVMIVGAIGARATHVYFEAFDFYREHPDHAWHFWEGGFVWYGGALAGAVAGLTFLQLQREPLGRWLDVFAPVGAMGYGLGRIACWLVGCCYGRFCEIGRMSFQFPTQAFAVVWELLALTTLLLVERRQKNTSRQTVAMAPGSIFSLWLVMHGSGRLIMELFRADDRGPTLGPVTFSILVSACLIALGLLYLIRTRFRF